MHRLSWCSEAIIESFTSSMKQVSGVKAEVDLDAAAPRLSFNTTLFFDTKPI
jgi:hypothetical protein